MKCEVSNSKFIINGENELFKNIHLDDYFQGCDLSKVETIKLQNINAQSITTDSHFPSIDMKYCVINDMDLSETRFRNIRVINSTVNDLKLGVMDNVQFNYFTGERLDIKAVINLNLLQVNCHLFKLLYLGTTPTIKACDISIFEVYRTNFGFNKVKVPRKIEGIKYCNIPNLDPSSKIFIKRNDEYIDLAENKKIILKHNRLFLKPLDTPIDIVPFMMYLV